MDGGIQARMGVWPIRGCEGILIDMPGWNYVLAICLNKAYSGLTRALAVKPARKRIQSRGRTQELVATCLINMPAARGCTKLVSANNRRLRVGGG